MSAKNEWAKIELMTAMQWFRAGAQEFAQIPKEAAVPVRNLSGQMYPFPNLSAKA